MFLLSELVELQRAAPNVSSVSSPSQRRHDRGLGSLGKWTLACAEPVSLAFGSPRPRRSSRQAMDPELYLPTYEDIVARLNANFGSRV